MKNEQKLQIFSEHFLGGKTQKIFERDIEKISYIVSISLNTDSVVHKWFRSFSLECAAARERAIAAAENTIFLHVELGFDCGGVAVHTVLVGLENQVAVV